MIRVLLIILSLCTVARAASSEDKRIRALDHFIRGTIKEQADDPIRAIYDFQEALRFDSTSAFINAALAQSYLSVGNLDKAEQALNRALKLEPSNIPALELKALMLRGTERFSEARATLEQLTAVKPDNQKYSRELLSVLLTQKEFDRADRVCFALKADSSEQSMLFRQMVAVYLTDKSYKRALPYLEKLRALDPHDPSVYFSSGTTYLQLEDTAQAIDFMARATSLDAKEPRFWNGRAMVALNQQKYERVIELADSGIALAGGTAGLYNSRGFALYRLNKLPEAIVALKQSVAADTGFLTPLGGLALIYDGLDSLEQAVHYYQSAIKISDSAAVFLNNLAYTYATRKIHLELAYELAQAAIKKDPDNPSYKDTMGWIVFGQGDHDEALRWLREAVKDAPESAEVLEHLGDVYLAKGSKSKAQDYYHRALKLEPANPRLLEKSRP